MKHYLLAICLFLTTSVLAQDQREFNVTCDSTEKIMNALKEQFKEIPIAVGISHDSVNSITSIWLNPETSTFTIVQSYKEISCVLVTGQDFDLSTDIARQGTPI
jgi:hypothetical protein